jgi:hypothetical protein
MTSEREALDELALAARAWEQALRGRTGTGSFFDLGGDSAGAVELVSAIEATTGLSLPFSLLVTGDGLPSILSWIRAERALRGQ